MNQPKNVTYKNTNGYKKIVRLTASAPMFSSRYLTHVQP